MNLSGPTHVLVNMTRLDHFILWTSALWGIVVCDHCPLGKWISLQGSCILFSDQGLTWQQASDDCHNFGASLLRFYGTKDRELFTTAIANMTTERWWTALNDIKHPGGWVWGNADSQVIAENGAVVWNVEPDDRNHIENCAALNIQGTVGDQKCSERHGYICEYNPGIYGCPLGWIVTTSNCYYVSDLTDEFSLLSWSDASHECNSRSPNTSSNLLRLETATEQAYIRRQLADLQITDQLFWIGMTDQAKEGQWTWDDGSSVDQTKITWTIEPNNLGGTESCGIMYNDGRFADADCSRVEKYICQAPEKADSPLVNKLGCPSGWVRAAHKCYFFQIMERVEQTAAAADCKHMGGRLLQIESKDERDWLDVQTVIYKAYEFWTGLQYDIPTKRWIWNGGSKPNMDLIQWDREPYDEDGSKDCGTVTKDGKFTDSTCFAHLAYICEMQTEDQPCPNGWIARSNQDMFTCYLISNGTDADLTTWQEARDKCKERSEPLDGYLLAVNDKDEAAFIAKEIQRIPRLTFLWWNGLNDRKREGYWEYDTAFNNPVNNDVIPWAIQPDNSDGHEYCTVVRLGGRYADIDCTIPFNYICETMVDGLSYSSSGSSLRITTWTLFITLYFIIYSV